MRWPAGVVIQLMLDPAALDSVHHSLSGSVKGSDLPAGVNEPV